MLHFIAFIDAFKGEFEELAPSGRWILIHGYLVFPFF